MNEDIDKDFSSHTPMMPTSGVAEGGVNVLAWDNRLMALRLSGLRP
ncbi:Uncharacterised protein [Salmonella enterica subsp. enterica]|nr:Uncharacterised protein [Salmonella enterica subsp. enterica]